MEHTKPVIFLAFANPAAGTQTHLRNLGEEARQLEDVIRQAQEDNLCELVIKSYAGLEEIVDVFQEYRNRIAIFHYGGHAQNFMLMLENSGGNTATNRNGDENYGTTMIDGRGLATFLGQQDGLQLVFLNACSTQPQVDELLNANIPAVIATSQSIRDDVATTLATHFYQSLTSGANLQKAFNEAEGVAQAMVGKGSVRDAYFEDSTGVAMTEFYHWPWSLTIKQGAEQLNEWSLAEAANEPLFGLPPLPEYALPNVPFRHLNFFTEQHAEIFFGRGHQIRTLYELVTTPDSASILLFYGESGVGKSSMLAAGLLPRLQRQTIHYVRRDQGLGLTGTLAQTLWTDETVPELLDAEIIAKRWHELEQMPDSRTRKPLIIVLDQVEEIFTRPNHEQPHELTDFLDVLNVLFAQRSQIPQGKLILGFRKEWLADIEDAMKRRRLPRTKFFLSRLTRVGIIEAVTGVARSTRLQTHYHLAVEAGLAEIIADDLLEDPDSPIAPTLQILLVKMWKECEKGNLGQPHFDIVLYQSLKRKGLLLRDFLQQQLDKLHEWRAEVVDSGLVLDVLAAHTTPQGTVDHHTEAELLDLYRHLEHDIPPLVQKCEELYLLFNPISQQADQSKSSRLAHDALASLTRHQYEESNKPGQRARRILDSRIGEWVDEQGQPAEGNPLDENDLRLVEDGLNGTRHLSLLEQQLLEASRVAQIQREQERKLQRRFRNGLFALVGAVAVVAFLVVWVAMQLNNLAAAHSMVSEIQQHIERKDYRMATLLSLEAQHLDPSSIQQIRTGELLEGEQLIYVSEVTRQSGHDDVANHVAWSPDGVTLASASDDHTVRLWHMETGKPIAVLDGHTDAVHSIAWSPDGTMVASTSADKTIILWDTETHNRLAVFVDHTDEVWDVAWHPDGTILASASADNSVILWDVSAENPIATLKGHTASANSISWNPTGELLASASDDKTIIVWNTTTYERMTTLDASFAPIWSVAWHPDDPFTLVSTSARHVLLWDMATYTLVDTLKHHSDNVHTVTWHPDGETLVSVSDENIVLWDATTYEPILTQQGDSSGTNGIAWHPHHEILAFGASDGTVIAWQMTTQQGVTTLQGHQHDIQDIAWSPDGQMLASASADNTIMLWDAATHEHLATLQGHSDWVRSIAWHPDGHQLASASDDSTIILWDVKTQEKLGTLEGHSDFVLDVAWSPDGTTLASASMDTTVMIWDVTDMTNVEHLITLEEHIDWVRSVAWSPDGTTLASGADDSSLYLWDMTTYDYVEFVNHWGWIMDVTWSPDGTMLASASDDSGVILWNAETHNEIASLDVGLGWTNSLTWSPDGKVLASATNNNTITLWDLATGKHVASHSSHAETLTSIAWRPDGAVLASAANDDMIKLWPVSLMRDPCRLVVQNLDADEWMDARPLALHQATCPKYPIPKRASLLDVVVEETPEHAFYFAMMSWQDRLWMLMFLLLTLLTIATLTIPLLHSKWGMILFASMEFLSLGVLYASNMPVLETFILGGLTGLILAVGLWVVVVLSCWLYHKLFRRGKVVVSQEVDSADSLWLIDLLVEHLSRNRRGVIILFISMEFLSIGFWYLAELSVLETFIVGGPTGLVLTVGLWCVFVPSRWVYRKLFQPGKAVISHEVEATA